MKDKNLKKIIGSGYINDIKNLVFLAEGMDFLTYRGKHESFGDVVLRIPKSRQLTYGNESYSSNEIIKKEIQIYQILSHNNIPSPQVYYYDCKEYPFIVYEYISNDKSIFDTYQLGMIMKNIHSITFNDSIFIDEFKCFLSNRLYDRLQYINNKLGIPNPFKKKEEIFSSLLVSNEMSLLHMDIRPDNILSLKKDIKGIIDWTYAMIGDPYFELCRIKEFDYANDYKLIDMEFIKGYGNYKLLKTSKLTELIYDLDAAVMVLILFYENRKFINKFNRQKKHVKQICGQIKSILNKKEKRNEKFYFYK